MVATVFVKFAELVEPMRFDGTPLDSTVAVFKQEVAKRFEASFAFQLHLKSRYCKDAETLAEIGVVDGTSLRMQRTVGAETKGVKRFRDGESKRSKYAHLAAQNTAIQQAVGGVATTQATLLEGQTKMQADVTAIRVAVEGAPPVNIPGELQLMELILDKLKVGFMNELLLRWGIDRPPGIKKNGKARLLAQKAPLAELQEVLRDPAASGSQGGALGLNVEDSAAFRARLAAQLVRTGTLDEYTNVGVASSSAVPPQADVAADGEIEQEMEEK